jgi:hypothetical protein
VAYDESRTNQQVTWYLGQPGGTLNTGTLDFSPGVKAGQGSVFVIGNHTNFNAGWRNPGTGRIDEFAIWHRVLSTTEVNNQFAALASSPSVAQPALAITHAGPDVLISWPASTAGSYLLEATNVLNSTTLGAPSWPSAGTASVVGPNYVVTNAISAGSRFYRLRSP